MTRADLDDFVACYRSGEVYQRAETERFRKFALDALIARDKLNLDIFWLKDDALEDPDLLPPSDEVAAEVVESLEAALASFRSVATKLQGLCGKVRDCMCKWGRRRERAACDFRRTSA